MAGPLLETKLHVPRWRRSVVTRPTLGERLSRGAESALTLVSAPAGSRLVPRVIPVLGLIGAPLLITAVFATLFTGIGQVSAFVAIATLPVAAWEFSLGVWLVVKGFNPSPITAEMTAAHTVPAYHDVTV